MERVEKYDDLINPLVISRLRDKVKFMGMVGIENRRADDLEANIWELMNECLDNCFGKQLDIAGDVVGRDREGMDDESYRLMIKLQNIINCGSGEPEVLIRAVKEVFGASEVDYTPVYPAKVRIWDNGDFGIFQIDDFENLSGDDLFFMDGEQVSGRTVAGEPSKLLQQLLPSGVDLLSAHSVVDMEGSEMSFLDGSDVIGVIYE
jgi:hypothetical protein